MTEPERVLLRTYNTAWKFERKIYAIDRIRLIVPVNPDEAAYFIVSEICVYILAKIVPLISTIPFVILYILLPLGLTKFLTKTKLDGKLPHKFVAAYVGYWNLPTRICRFEPATIYKAGVFDKVVYRNRIILNVTDELTKKWRKAK